MSRMGWTGGRLLLAMLTLWCAGLVAGCEDKPPAEKPISVEAYLSGPGARLGAGIRVPEGAVRVGPTVPIDQKRDGTVVSQISMLRLDADPDRVLRDLLTMLDRRIPDAGVEPAKLRRRCWLDDTRRWIRQCRLFVAGHTADGEPLQVDVTVTPSADTAGVALPGTTGLPHARVLIRRDTIRELGTNLSHPVGYPYSIRDQEAAQWPIASDADDVVDEPVDTIPGADDWPVRPGGIPIGVVTSNPRYIVVAVDEEENVEDVATSYITGVPYVRLTTRRVARIAERTTTSYELAEVEGGSGAHLWAIDRPGTDYLFLRYWPVES